MLLFWRWAFVMVVFRKSSSFFLSGRRRHTRCSRDWSSDVCSSDLGAGASRGGAGAAGPTAAPDLRQQVPGGGCHPLRHPHVHGGPGHRPAELAPGAGEPGHRPGRPRPADRRGPAGPCPARHDVSTTPRYDRAAPRGAPRGATRERSRGTGARGGRPGVECSLAVLAIADRVLQQQPDGHGLPQLAPVRHLPRELYVALRPLLDALQRVPAGAVPGVGERRARYRGRPGGGRAPPGERPAHPAARRALHRVRANRDRRRQRDRGDRSVARAARALSGRRGDPARRGHGRGESDPGRGEPGSGALRLPHCPRPARGDRGARPVTSAQAATFRTGDTPQPDIVILTHKLTRNYDMGGEVVHALRGVDFQIRRNEFVAIMGPSGSGKSTLMNLIGCLDTPTAGEYWLNGQKVSDLSDDELARIRNKEIGFVFQTFNLLPRATALHNVELPLIYAGLPARERREHAARALTSVGLGDRMDHRPNELSGGQRQRVAIARALVNAPSILLADEPTGNLDSATSAELMQVFGDLHRQGQTIVMVTHEHDIAAHAARVVTLRDGVIATDQLQAA